MKFGIFDHLDRNDLPLHTFYEERLKLVELYDRGGFLAYHTAEHHATPLGLAASPSVFLAAVAQRTGATCAFLRWLRCFMGGAHYPPERRPAVRVPS